ncbi:hypothetical protein [Burkholderia multivorans]|uniref:hypothetical protein n=1 Tax=Burkholderia multivorans TaxID=87883 RepID=UPI00351010E1
MDEREMFEATLVELTKRDEETFDKPFPNDDINVLWAIWKEARRTTPDRDAVIEECARACERVAEGRSVVEMNVGAKLCADAVRALKTTPTAASSSEATDTERLDWLAWTGIAIRNEHASGRWYLQAPYHTNIACVDDYKRFDTFRAAIDAARAGGVS